MQVLKSKTSMVNVLGKFAARDGKSPPLAHHVFIHQHRQGIPSLWTGLSASILRQSTYSTARFGIHSHLSSKVLAYNGEKKLSLSTNIACAGIAGGVAGIIGNPAEVVLVRMCADGAKAPGQQFAYSNALNGMVRVYRDEGLGVFGKGITANVARSVLMSK